MMISRTQMMSEHQLILEASGVGVWRYEIETDEFHGDSVCRALLGIESDEEHLTLDTVLQHVHVEDRQMIGKLFSGVGLGMETLSFEFKSGDPDQTKYLLSRARHLPDLGGTPGKLMGVLIDDTENRHLKQSLDTSEAKLRMLVDGFPSLFVYLNTRLEIETVNDAFLKACGLPMDQIIGKSSVQLLGDRFITRQSYLERALAGEAVSFEDYGVDIGPATQEQFFRYNYKPALDNDGKVIGILCEATNITERRKLELELRRSNQDLEQFAYVASHDLKAPLRAIEVIVSWLTEDLVEYEGGDVKENLNLLGQRTKRLGRLLDDLLAYSRAGRKVGKIAQVNTKHLVHEILQMIGPPESIEVQVSDALPIISTYGAPLEQVLRNLINNAIKHHPGPNGRISVSSEDSENHHVFVVSDDGSGIPEEYADRVFQMFQTLKPRDEIEGSGMGLAIVSRIVEWQGGRIWFEPGNNGVGTTFKFQWSKTAPQTNTGEQAA